MKIEDIENIIGQAPNGVIEFGQKDAPWRFYVRFATRINGELNKEMDDCPVLDIPDFKLFVDSVNKYMNYAKRFYDDEKDYLELDDDSFEQYLFLMVLMNANNYDFNNIIKYIDDRIKMFQSEDIKKSYLGNIGDEKVDFIVAKLPPNLETPYKAIININKGETRFILPQISFGIVDGIVKIYAIQNVAGIDKDNVLFKKYDRYFRKFNKDVDMEDVIANISTNSLAALTLFVSKFKQLGYKKFEFVDYLPLRYEANLVADYNWANRKNSAPSPNILREHDRDQYNMTNKMLYAGLRYAYHFDNVECSFDENRQVLTVNIVKDMYTEKDNVIYKLDRLPKQKEMVK